MFLKEEEGVRALQTGTDPIPNWHNDQSTTEAGMGSSLGRQDIPSGFGAETSFFLTVTVILVVLGATTFFHCYGRRHARKKAEAKQQQIFAYLQQFDVEDIDLRKSPPGGWHGTYKNLLVYGMNPHSERREPSNRTQLLSRGSKLSYEKVPLTDSDGVRDSLVVESLAVPSLGFCDATSTRDDDLDDSSSELFNPSREEETSRSNLHLIV